MSRKRVLYFLIFVFTFFSTCKKDKSFGEKYPELVGEWEWVMGYTMVECGGIKYGASPGGASSFCPKYFFPDEKLFEITKHRIEINKNGVIKIYSISRLLEKDILKFHSTYQYYDKLNNLDYRVYDFIKKKNCLTNNFFNSSENTFFSLDKKFMSFTYKYYYTNNTEELIISTNKVGKEEQNNNKYLNLLYKRK